ncbi:hypothetical protein [Bifidobacterium myosotis]|uniref:Uncharacterized protein n=1 Tax=Bifidobacterium myosotis TaxID=1630166 RepID=A0A5M9ZH83_9BIFI|nr:hypothetical protein [Bifidobacterium myosotis]KAA8826977.1 hypothetical protein EMO91_10625 [Bifidobacterium myosotis]
MIAMMSLMPVGMRPSGAELLSMAALAVSILSLAVSIGRDSPRPSVSVSQDVSDEDGRHVRVLRVANAGVGAMFDLRLESSASVTPSALPRLDSGGVWEASMSYGRADGGIRLAEDDPAAAVAEPLDPGMPDIVIRYRTAPFQRARRLRVPAGRMGRFAARV